MPSVCFCKWSQTFFNGASRHLVKMPPQLRLENAISHFSKKSYRSCPYSTWVFSQMPSVCFCKWSQTFFNGASRHPDKKATTRFENAISHFSTNPYKSCPYSTSVFSQMPLGCFCKWSQIFLMVPKDILTKCHHKIWICHQPVFHGPWLIMLLRATKFQHITTSIFH